MPRVTRYSDDYLKPEFPKPLKPQELPFDRVPAVDDGPGISPEAAIVALGELHSRLFVLTCDVDALLRRLEFERKVGPGAVHRPTSLDDGCRKFYRETPGALHEKLLDDGIPF